MRVAVSISEARGHIIWKREEGWKGILILTNYTNSSTKINRL